MTEKRKPSLDDTLAGESSKGFNEISNFADRVNRYSDAKARQLRILNHVRGLNQGKMPNNLASPLDFEKLNSQLGSCGNYLVFNQYYTVGQVRLAKASFCKNHLLCQLCAIRRGAKQVQAYLGRCEVVECDNPDLKPYMLTLTVKNGHDFAERLQHLQDSVKRLMKRRRDFNEKGRGFSQLAKADGGVYSYEVTRGKDGWHPHVHMVIYMNPSDPIDFPFDVRPKKFSPDEWQKLSLKDRAKQKKLWRDWGLKASDSGLAREWLAITGDSKVVDLRPIEGEKSDGLVEVFKYALKFSDLSPSENVEAYAHLKGKRLTGSFGCLWGVKVPEKMTDDLLDDLPYIELFYKYSKAGYSLASALPKDVKTYSKSDKKFLDGLPPASVPLAKANSVFHTNKRIDTLIQTIGHIYSDPNCSLSREGPARREGSIDKSDLDRMRRRHE